ncbi:DUF6382 domain-containing protein [Paenibacillus sp. J2TS4]|uniref:DUF6382 domain-containing protein n=1 Tax=Paenibacillus sp. J2TS4 TaxID=2807194 RepID=UPI001B145595|nr:DUF6382 domain-containing protein [Paenibacillus sp. J2TS4]GIP32683.1 hypothetical protein J2TS4_18930 [Paenibacillus sp. J2TS4]
MTTLLYGLKCETVRQHGSYLVLSSDPPLTREDLVPLEYKMLETYTVPRQLPIEFEERDRTIQFRYDTTSLTTLTEVIKRTKLSEEQFYTFIYTIVTILDDSKIYMLNEERYVLKEEYIYIGQQLADIQLLYLPLHPLSGKGNAQQDLIRLADYLAKHTAVSGSERWRKLQTLLSGGQFSLIELKAVLLDGLGETAQPSPDTMEAAAEYVPRASINEKTEEPAVEFNIPEDRPLVPKLLVLFSAALLVGVWYYYGTHPSEGLLYICLGVSLLIADGLFVLHKIGKLPLTFHTKNMKPERAAVGPVPVQEKYDAGPSFRLSREAAPERRIPRMPEETRRGLGASWVSGADSQAAPTRLEMMHPSPDPDLDSFPASEQNPVVNPDSDLARAPNSVSAPDLAPHSTLTERTTLLIPQDETVLLTPDGVQAMIGSLRPFLEVQREDDIEKVPVAEDSFRIGRSQEAVHYVEDTVGVSRVHLEIGRSKEQEGYYVKDLGSKNGSYLNEERLIPYREYALQGEDRITIATVDMIFKNPL